MRAKWMAAVGFLVWAAGSTGCLRNDRACESSATCGGDDVCVEGLCQSGSGTPADASGDTSTPDAATSDASSPDVDPGRDATADADDSGVSCVDVTPSRCGGVCVDTTVDRRNCGECGKVCAPDQKCTAGKCEEDLCAIDGLIECDGECAVCPSNPNASEFTCEDGACLIDACRAGWAPCAEGCCEGAQDIEPSSQQGSMALGLHTSIALTPNGSPHIIYHQEDASALNWYWWDSTDDTWNSGYVGEGVDLDFDEVSDLVALSREDVTFLHAPVSTLDGSRSLESIRGSLGATSARTQLVSGDARGGFRAVLERDADGDLHAAYVSGTSQLRYASLSGSTWLEEAPPAIDGEATDVSLAMDTQGHPHMVVSYLDMSALRVEHVWWTGANWSREPVPFSPPVGTPVRISIDGQSRLHIIGHDPDDSSVEYARKDGQTWSLERVDAQGEVGSHADMAVDPWGRPHVSYYDKSGKDLKYAVRKNRVWRVAIVAQDGNVGTWNAIAVDRYGRPHISYHDETTGALRYTYNDGIEWRVTQ